MRQFAVKKVRTPVFQSVHSPGPQGGLKIRGMGASSNVVGMICLPPSGLNSVSDLPKTGGRGEASPPCPFSVYGPVHVGGSMSLNDNY